VHDPPKSCCAIDYCCRTLDHAAGILTSSKHFPSRLSLGMGGEGGGGRHQGERHLTSIFRRLYRIFAHAWFQHRSMFWQIEGEHGLYVFFKTVSDRYSLIPEDTYTVPPEAEGIDVDKALDESFPPSIVMFKKIEDGEGTKNEETTGDSAIDAKKAANTRRHKSTPSTTLLTTTMEVPEEEDETSTVQKLPETEVIAEEVVESEVKQTGNKEEAEREAEGEVERGVEREVKEVEKRTENEDRREGGEEEETCTLGNEPVAEEIIQPPAEVDMIEKTAAAAVKAEKETSKEGHEENGSEGLESDGEGTVEAEASGEP
jgi:hypothetical protein